jgi:hypothetical protein
MAELVVATAAHIGGSRVRPGPLSRCRNVGTVAVSVGRAGVSFFASCKHRMASPIRRRIACTDARSMKKAGLEGTVGHCHSSNKQDAGELAGITPPLSHALPE